MWPRAGRRAGIFVCLEGIDCTGKTSVAHALCALLGAQYFHGPADPLKTLIAGLPVTGDRVFEYFLHRAAVQADSKIIETALRRGHVVADRYIDSTHAYFCASVPKLRRIVDQIGLCKPDVTYLLTTRREVRQRRLLERTGANARERDLAFQNAAQTEFLRKGHPTIDTSDTDVETTASIIHQKLRRRFWYRTI